MDQKLAVKYIVLSRFLTRFGDHAWDLAIPLLLIKLYPGTLSAVALYSISTTIGKIVLITPLSRGLDRISRLRGVTNSILAQIIGVLGVGFLVATDLLEAHQFFNGGVGEWLFFFLLALCGVIAQVGASLTHISVASDWVPKLFSAGIFAQVNSKIKRADLLTEVLAPIAAGLVLTWKFGFFVVLALNVGSFIFEYTILYMIYHANPGLEREAKPAHAAQSFFKSLGRAYKVISAQYAAPTMIAYGLLWFQVLTPHGSILTAYLKDLVSMSEDKIGIFRALGALFGLLPTFIFARLVRTVPIEILGLRFLIFQVTFMFAACLFLQAGAVYPFLGAILLSRIGLYGFSLAEVQIRQETVPEEMRAEVAGAGTALSYSSHLIFYITVLIFSELSDFQLLAWASCGAATLAALSTSRLLRSRKAP